MPILKNITVAEATVYVVQYFDQEGRRRVGTKFCSGDQVEHHLASFNRYTECTGIEARIVLTKSLRGELLTAGKAVRQKIQGKNKARVSRVR
jgi:hypothetical protein